MFTTEHCDCSPPPAAAVWPPPPPPPTWTTEGSIGGAGAMRTKLRPVTSEPARRHQSDLTQPLKNREREIEVEGERERG